MCIDRTCGEGDVDDVIGLSGQRVSNQWWLRWFVDAMASVQEKQMRSRQDEYLAKRQQADGFEPQQVHTYLISHIHIVLYNHCEAHYHSRRPCIQSLQHPHPLSFSHLHRWSSWSVRR